MPVFSPEEYAANGGSKCPSCGSHNISTTDQIELDGETGGQPVECLHCGATWTDAWKLTGYFNLEAKS